MKNTEQRQIERIAYWEGQLLRSGDFAAAQNADDQRRWWHNRALHNAYGVSLGLEVKQDANRLALACGLAYDSLGRELVLPYALRFAFPNVQPDKPGEPSESRVLIIRYKPIDPARDGLFACDPCGSQCRTADLAFLRLSRFDPRTGVPVAQVNWDPAGNPQLDPQFEAPRALPIARPALGSGVTPEGGTVWDLWSAVIPDTPAPPQTLGLQTRVDTSAAGFAVVPVYIAQLQIGASQDTPHVLPPPICRVDEASPDSFLFRVWLPRLHVQADLKFEIPSTKITDSLNDGKTLKVESNEEFQENDPVRLIGGKIVSIIQKVHDDRKTIEINPAFPNVNKMKDPTLRLAFLNSLDRIASLIEPLKFFPGMVVVIIGQDEVNLQTIVQYYTVVVSGSGAVSLFPPITPNLHLGDKPNDVPHISIVNTGSVDIARAVQSLKWHVSWVGATCCNPPEFPCTDQECEISVSEVC